MHGHEELPEFALLMIDSAIRRFASAVSSNRWMKIFVSMKSALIRLVPRETVATSLDARAHDCDYLPGECRPRVAATVLREPASELLVQR